MEQKDMVIEKVGWITRMKSTPPLTEEYINNQYLRLVCPQYSSIRRELQCIIDERGLTCFSK